MRESGSRAASAPGHRHARPDAARRRPNPPACRIATAPRLVRDRITLRFPFLERIFADPGYQGPRVAVAAAAPRPVEIIKRTDARFVVQPKRWVIDRTFAWTAALPVTSSASPTSP
jgi:putative transposase